MNSVDPTPGLMPCPFCGGAPTNNRYQDYDNGRRQEGWQVSTVGCPNCEIEFTNWTEAQAIAAWNTRTQGGKQSSHTAGEGEVERIAASMSPVLFSGKADEEVGPATLSERNKIRGYARAALSATQSSHTDLLEALEPFAKAGAELAAETPTDMAVFYSANGKHIRLADLRRAEAAYDAAIAQHKGQSK